MIAKCIDNSHTWRNILTLEKHYGVIESFSDPEAGYLMIKVICDDEEVRTYRANRFNLSQD